MLIIGKLHYLLKTFKFNSSFNVYTRDFNTNVTQIFFKQLLIVLHSKNN